MICHIGLCPFLYAVFDLGYARPAKRLIQTIGGKECRRGFGCGRNASQLSADPLWEIAREGGVSVTASVTALPLSQASHNANQLSVIALCRSELAREKRQR